MNDIKRQGGSHLAFQGWVLSFDGIRLFYTREEPPSTIDHPYLLPPSSGRVEYCTKSGKTYQMADGFLIHDVLCRAWLDGEVPYTFFPSPPRFTGEPYLIELGTGKRTYFTQ